MQFKDITLSNISSFIEGYSNWFMDKYLPKHKREQVLYRATQCPPECAQTGKCKYCGCDYPQKLYVTKSCNRDKQLPDIMDEGSWNLYKEKLKSEKTNKLP